MCSLIVTFASLLSASLSKSMKRIQHHLPQRHHLSYSSLASAAVTPATALYFENAQHLLHIITVALSDAPTFMFLSLVHHLHRNKVYCQFFPHKSDSIFHIFQPSMVYVILFRYPHQMYLLELQ